MRMVMRVPIREQLGCLVLLSSLIGLAVIAIATWITNHNFVLALRSTRLSLTASLKAAQLAGNLLTMQTTLRQTASRLAVQAALRRYNVDGNASDSNWDRTRDDFDAVFVGEGDARLAIQARLYPSNSSDFYIFNRTATNLLGSIKLPQKDTDNRDVFFGQVPDGYPPSLYPKFTPFQKQVSVGTRTAANQWFATYDGREINGTNMLLSGPYRINSTLSLVSIMTPVINNTSSIDTMGWLVVVLDAGLITRVVDALEGLDNSGLAMIVGSDNSTNKFPTGTLYSQEGDPNEEEVVSFVLPPTNRSGMDRHHAYAMSDIPPPFNWSQFPAVERGFTKATNASNNAGSIVSTKNEMGANVAIGYAIVDNSMVDWMLLVEQSHNEVWAPINRLRNVLLACVFGTIGAMLLLAFPVAHFSSRPIRRLRDATRGSVAPHVIEDDSLSSQPEGTNDGHDEALARKEGFFGSIVHYRRNHKATKAERREAERRRQFRIPAKVKDRRHFIHDELTDLTATFNDMTDELMMQYERLEERVQQRTAELEQSKQAAEAANESKTLFIANISHELKTPLNGILGMCAVCMSEDDPIKLRRSLGIIYKSGDLLLNLLTDLLTFSKNQVGQQLSLDEKEFRLRDISSQVLAIFERQAKEGGIKLTVKFEGPYEANLDYGGRPNERGDFGPFGLGRLKDMVMYGDQHRILQVVINLVSNSLKFTPKGGAVTISIRCLGEDQMSESRKVSLQSRNSSLRGSKARKRASSSERGSISASTSERNDTANVINAREKTGYAHMMAQDRAPTPPPGRWLSFEFEVEDTGPGIPETLHDKIFEPFVQGDLGLSKKYGGTGLGLSICSQLAGLMKGTISLKSEVGQGSVFTMAIPLKHLSSRADSTASSSSNVNSARASLQLEEAPVISNDALAGYSVQSANSVAGTSSVQPPSANNPVPFDSDVKPRLVGLSQPFFASNPPLESPNSQTAAMKRVEAEATQRGDKIRVLVAEDNKTNQEVVLRMLKLEDVYDVTVAKDGQEALDKVKESMENQMPYNLIFMDVQMPNLDGLQSTRLIRQSGFSAPIVALTAYAEESNIKECYNSGMNFFLSKPIRRPALKHVLKTYCAPIPEEEGESTTPPGNGASSSSTKPARANGKPSNANPGQTSTDVPVATARTTSDEGISPLTTATPARPS
ncbi:osmolarity two-component system protein sln1 [Byssothecium circinans]|uniref:histidine kinase n=1 Tax=Byssothecium circinans TaxID=147558 RepID=A0A6A5TSL3_9PLEO|nr:osmolarity two-component system protein sln1 [Byssothecium circinans]